MTKQQPTRHAQAEDVEIPDVIDADEAQLAVFESMDTDPRTGAKVKIGQPETDDDTMVQDFVVWLQESADANNQDSMARLAEMLRQASTAESVADALRDTPTISGKDFVDMPFLATGFEIHEGSFDAEEIPYFASIRAQHPNYPQGLVINCGGEKVLVHLYTLERLGQWPIPLKFTGKSTRKGHVVLSLELVKQKPL